MIIIWNFMMTNIRETYVHPEAGDKECVQRTQYYPSGLPWVEAMMPSEQPWKYNGKEFVEMHGLDEYDSKARWYYPAICRTTTMDPLAEKYYSTSPYAWCGNNPVNIVDHDGRELWRLDINTGTFIRISDEGKDETDYYQIGTMINNEFAQYVRPLIFLEVVKITLMSFDMKKRRIVQLAHIIFQIV